MRFDRGPATFWWLQIAGWGFYGVATFLTFLTAVEPDVWQGLFLFKAVARPVAGIIVTSVLAIALRRAEAGPGWSVAFVAAAASLVAAAAWYVLSALFAGVLRPGPMPPLRPETPHGLWEYVFVMLAWSATFLCARAWRRSRDRERQALEADVRASEANFSFLASQLDPHFLFNALSALRGRIRNDPERAERVLTQLAGYLRSVLVRPGQREITLAEELETVEAYLEVERARLGDELLVRTEIDRSALQLRVPAFSLHPLVENAVKHAPADDRTVRIRGHHEGSRLVLEVSNPGRLDTNDAPTGMRPSGTGIGLGNLRERLMLTHAGRHAFQLVERDGRIHARLEIDTTGNDDGGPAA